MSDNKINSLVKAFEHLLSNISLSLQDRAIIEGFLNEAKGVASPITTTVGKVAETVVTNAIAKYTGSFADDLTPIAVTVIDAAENKLEDAFKWLFASKFGKKTVGVNSAAGKSVKALLAASDNKVEIAAAALFQAKGYGNVEVTSK